jgi:SEC-C motif
MESSQLGSHALLRLISTGADAVPLELIDEAARRGDALQAELISILDDDSSWDVDPEEPRYWLPLHAIMILGKLDTESAGRALARALSKMPEVGFDLSDWFDGYWPALLANKPDSVLADFQALLDDRTLDAGSRAISASILLAAADRKGAQALDATLDVIARNAADESEPLEFRQLMAAHLIERPRARHSEALCSLADVRSEMGVMYSAADVDAALEALEDHPEWERFPDPWSFYSNEAIAARAEQWDELGELDELDDLEFDDVYIEPYVREAPKIGRNDPCSCGSGRKYKKCCLRGE